VDHRDQNPPWWTRSVLDHLGPRSDIFLIHSSGVVGLGALSSVKSLSNLSSNDERSRFSAKGLILSLLLVSVLPVS